MPHKQSGGVTTYFRQSGHGAEPGFFLHCSLAQSSAWAGVMAGLEDEMTMTAMDLPGHGRSADWDGRRDIAQQAQDMALGLLPLPAHLVGHSFGAYLALRLAVEAPDRVMSLTLIDPVFFRAARDVNPELYHAHEARTRAYLQAIDHADTRAMAQAFTEEWGGGAPWASVPADMQDYFADRMDLIIAAEPALAEDSGGVFERLPDVSCPVVLVDGGQSPEIMAAIMDGLSFQIPQAQRITLADAGHMAPLSHPAQIADAIRLTVQSVSASRARN